MTRRGQTTTFQERVEITERAAQGQSDPAIAAALGCSPATVRKWRRRGRRHGAAGLASPMGRPATGPLGAAAPAVRDTLLALRRAHPGWGPDTLLAEVQADPRWAGLPLPGRSRVAALIKEAGLTRRYQRHTDLPVPQAALSGTPHEEWELDAQGMIRVEGVGPVSLISIVDTVSRLKVECYPCMEANNPPLPAYQLLLRRAFTAVGLPRRISFDHGTVFYDNTSPSPFPTRLHLWLIALGVEVVFTRKRCPTDHARIERTHQTMTLQALLGQRWPDQGALWAGLDRRRAMLNERIPCRPLSGQAPLQAFPGAAHSGRPYRPEREEALLDLGRVHRYLSACRFFRQVKPCGVFALGGYNYYLGKKLRGRTLVLSFDPAQGAWAAQVDGSAETLVIAPQGLTKSALMGELSRLLALPGHQLALPFTPEAWRQIEYAHALAGPLLPGTT